MAVSDIIPSHCWTPRRGNHEEYGSFYGCGLRLHVGHIGGGHQWLTAWDAWRNSRWVGSKTIMRYRKLMQFWTVGSIVVNLIATCINCWTVYHFYMVIMLRLLLLYTLWLTWFVILGWFLVIPCRLFSDFFLPVLSEVGVCMCIPWVLNPRFRPMCFTCFDMIATKTFSMMMSHI